MVKTLLRPFLIKTRLEAWAVIYAIAVGACTRGELYHVQYPGVAGWMLFTACTGVVFLAGGKILDATRPAAHRASSVRRVLERARAA
ncbi:MAG: hypothetical protein JOZ90_13445 [Alphaproteobacteria bacterium]|nr:hypothetical protein [Alphaproteobacteria bacterium]MBV9372888.1 hypothetical protein [Alphaproteobacteria bacterium]MBV9902076.1 hypothetical protein [Alphaproteobacteria bacterium]